MGFRGRSWPRTNRTVSNVPDNASDAQDHTERASNPRKKQTWDPFLDTDRLGATEDFMMGDVDDQSTFNGSLCPENSPYAEVRVAVPPTDDPGMLVDTLRAWVIGIVLSTLIAGANVVMALRSAPISIQPTVVQLIAYPICCFTARVLPDKNINIFGHSIPLNPGPFSVKEHTLITIMTAAGATANYAIQLLLAQEVFWNRRFPWAFQLALLISTQALGLGMAGITRRLLVWPASMVWPSTLVTATVMHSLHNHEPALPATTNGWKIGRFKFFLIIASATFVWEWVPQVMANFLSFFTFATWIAPDNVLVNQLFGGYSGLGLMPISFDWGTITGFLSSPLQFPTFSLLSIAFGLSICTLGAGGLAFAGADYYKYLPINANKSWDRFANEYNVSRILNADSTLNETAYHAYSPILLGAQFSLAYGMDFANIISTITHIAVFCGSDIWHRVRNSKYDDADIHLKLMLKYKEAPLWGFLLLFAISFAFGLAASLCWETNLPWWAYVLCILIGSVFFIPIGMFQAVTNTQASLGVITEMIFSYILPGRPLAMMLFKCWGYMLVFNGLQYVSDMKIGHYMKVPPRSMLRGQAVAAIWLPIVQTAVLNFLVRNVDDLCKDGQKQGLTCPNIRTQFNASIIWGVVGPRRVFGFGSIYSWTNYFWLVGFAMPIIQFLVLRKWPRSPVQVILWPVVFSAAALMPPATGYYLWQFVIVGLVFNYWFRRRFRGWWSQYNYVLSGALDTGLACCILVSTLSLSLVGRSFPQWWGNTVFTQTADWKLTARTKQFTEGVSAPLGPEKW